MKKLFTIILALALLSATAMPAFSQGRDSQAAGASRSSRADSQSYRDRTIWDKHRDKITVAGGTVAGGLLGAIIGGKKGALIGAAAGAGSSALYTYKIRGQRRWF